MRRKQNKPTFLKKVNTKFSKVIDFLQTRSVSKQESYMVKNHFKDYFDGVIDYSFYDETTEDGTFYFQTPKTTVRIKDLGLIDLKVYKLKGTTILEITTNRPGVCIGKGGLLIDAYTEHLRNVTNNQNFLVKLVEAKNLFKK